MQVEVRSEIWPLAAAFKISRGTAFVGFAKVIKANHGRSVAEFDDEFPGRDGSGCWDVWCVDHAELICQGSNDDIVCAAATNDACFTPHAGTGCMHGGCCLLVCEAWWVFEFCL